VKLSQQVQKRNLHWNGIVLLWGPPGTGKSTLCRAIAHKLSIRLNKTFPSSKLIEIDAHSLYSKYFGESAKLVTSLFARLTREITASPGTFFFVLIDEVESLACSRDSSAQSGTTEPRDSMRAVNALLTAIDRLRDMPNFVVLCTSNLVHAMDVAFLDRLDFKWYISLPGHEARYEILRMGLVDLVKIGAVNFFGFPGQGAERTQHEKEHQAEDLVPPWTIMQLRYINDRLSPAWRVWSMAEKCAVCGCLFIPS
jgi:SpoVK/Ycf46/Vps4 family AAA+-type ATPase